MSETVQNSDSNDATLRAEIDRSLRHPVMFFFTSGALWLFVAVLLGLISSVKTHSPEFLEGFTWLATGRVSLAHQSTLIYGWACQAAFGTIIWLMARLCRKRCQYGIVILVAGHIWNIAITLGVLGILGGASKGVSGMAFPSFVWPVLLLSYFLITIWSVLQFQLRDGKQTYISQWYLLAAILIFPWIFATGHLFVFVFDGHPLMKTAVAEWFSGAMLYLFFAPIAIAAAYYLAPKVSGRPVYSFYLAIFGFWALMVIGPWAGMQKLAGAPIPKFLPYAGAAATILFLIPALAVAVNILQTVFAENDGVVSKSPSLRFTVGGIVGMVLLGASGMLLNTANSLKATQFSLTGYGYEILAIYGFFSMCAFGLIYFVVPRVTRREWLSKRFIKNHYYFSIYGVGSIVIFSILGGFMQGIAQNAADKPWMDAAQRSEAYSVGTSLAWLFILFSNLIFLFHLLLMWANLGRHSTHPTLLGDDHHSSSPHGPEGDLDELQAANV